jgi:chloramphenicol O-acetyltransferase type A
MAEKSGKRIDIETWPRRESYELFRNFGFPYFSITANVDVTVLHTTAKDKKTSFTIGLVYVLSRAANAIPAFRQRMEGDSVVEYEVVYPSITILADNNQFRFCSLRYTEEFAEFAAGAKERIEQARKSDSMWPEPDRDDFLFMTSLPWIAFTAMIHPVPLDPPDSIPRFAWGKHEEHDGRISMPLNVQGHHALMDGVHVGRYFELVQELLDAFGEWKA